MLYRRGPSVVFHFPPETVDVIAVQSEDTPGRRRLAGVRVTGPSADIPAAVDPVSAMPPGVVQEARRREQVSELLVLTPGSRKVIDFLLVVFIFSILSPC